MSDGRQALPAATDKPTWKRWLAIATLCTVVVGSSVVLWRIADDSDSKKSGDSTPYAVTTDAFEFELPETPTVEPSEVPINGVTLTGTDWVIDSDIYLLVTSIDFGAPLEVAAIQAAFDSSTGGVIERSSGTLVSDEWYTTAGVYERITVSTYSFGRGGYIFQHGFAKGNWSITFMTYDSGSQPPSWFTDAVTSFSFV